MRIEAMSSDLRRRYETARPKEDPRRLLRMEPLRDIPAHQISGDPPPPAGVVRWVPKRKAAVVAAILSNRMTIEEACDMYGLSAEEILSWRNSIDRHGLKSLRTTSLQSFRRRP